MLRSSIIILEKNNLLVYWKAPSKCSNISNKLKKLLCTHSLESFCICPGGTILDTNVVHVHFVMPCLPGKTDDFQNERLHISILGD